MHLPKLPLVVLDTETTGFVPRVNRVIEFASVRTEKGEIVDEYETLIGIDDDVPDVVRTITRITTEDIAGKPSFEEQRAEIEKHIGDDALIVGQNVTFDINMLKGEGIDLSDRPWIDTSMLASLVFPELESYSLGYVSQVLDLNHEPVHRALGDVHATLELLERCFMRLLELPEEHLHELKSLFAKSAPGYQLFAQELSEPTALKRPEWMTMPTSSVQEPQDNTVTIEKPSVGTVDLVEESVDPSVLQGIIAACADDADTVHWIAVKNLTATIERLHLPDGVRVLQPPFLMLNTEAQDALLQQDTFSADEATLALKLVWYAPRVRSELPVHGDEKAVWDGKLVCTEQSASYRAQFEDLPSVVLLDHRQLLSFIADEESIGYQTLKQYGDRLHIIIDDASMLEDTATKAYGRYCNMDTLRAAAEGRETLTRFLDVLQIAIEKIRNFQDLRYLTVPDLSTPDACGVRELFASLLKEDHPEQTMRMLLDLEYIFNPDNIDGSIAWIEQRNDGAQFLQSVPDRVGQMLKEHLYDRYPVSLLVPPGKKEMLREVLPTETETQTSPLPLTTYPLPLLSYPEHSLRDLLENPPPGKTIVLQTSRGRIEQNFVQYTEALEEQGITLICQNLSGGQGRMTAEFLASEGTTLWLITPWMFEGLELLPESVDRLIIETVPFDHPKHAVFSRRAEHYRNAFIEYSLPRLMHRLFRVVRTFMRFAKDDPSIEVLDERLQQKEYGKYVVEYLSKLNSPQE